ncbi:MAG: hypothetical protein C0392_00675 [Syntrophus sp. (in: bacteria)]|nr:hypothetical protein [Syntrophus sp. (in: bacteria)]
MSPVKKSRIKTITCLYAVSGGKGLQKERQNVRDRQICPQGEVRVFIDITEHIMFKLYLQNILR